MSLGKRTNDCRTNNTFGSNDDYFHGNLPLRPTPHARWWSILATLLRQMGQIGLARHFAPNSSPSSVSNSSDFLAPQRARALLFAVAMRRLGGGGGARRLFMCRCGTEPLCPWQAGPYLSHGTDRAHR